MTIAIVAHDSKKELMAQFCIAYEGVLSKCRLIASGVTGNWIEEQTGLHVNCYLPGSEGGVHQIAASVFCHDIDMVLFFRDAQKAKEKTPPNCIFCGCAMSIWFRWPRILPQPKC